jgi:arsenic resistance protein ArsH
MTEFPALQPEFIDKPTLGQLTPLTRFAHPPRFLLLYGSLRERSFSRFVIEEADRLLRDMGAETRIYDPRGLPQVDDASPDHPKVKELREASVWSEGHVWCSPERHGAMTGLFKSQIDWLPLESGGVRLAVIQYDQPAACAWTLDADDHHSQPVERRQGV